MAQNNFSSTRFTFCSAYLCSKERKWFSLSVAHVSLKLVQTFNKSSILYIQKQQVKTQIYYVLSFYSQRFTLQKNINKKKLYTVQNNYRSTNLLNFPCKCGSLLECSQIVDDFGALKIKTVFVSVTCWYCR